LYFTATEDIKNYMSFWDFITRTKREKKTVEPDIRFGRYTDSYKSKKQYEFWDKALKEYENDNYTEAYAAFFQYLRDDKEDNVRWINENGGIQFEILQGSKRVSGFADARHVKAEARIAHAQELSVAFMRRLMEANYSLDYSRYALDDDNNLVIKFETSALDGSPYKLYYALKEVAINADKLDDLLLDEFQSHLIPIDMGSKKDIPFEEKEAKYAFIKKEIQNVINTIDSGNLNADKYPSGISYLLLSLVYKLDFLTAPEGFFMETIERINRSYFDNDGRTLIQKNVGIKKDLEKVLLRDKDLIFKELYATSSSFGILTPKGHDTLMSLIDGELPNMDWYEENKHTQVAIAVPGYIVGNALFNYALPKPDRELLALFYQILESDYFISLGFEPPYLNTTTNSFNIKSIKSAIRQIVEAHKEKYPLLSPDLNILDFSSPCRFARTYLVLLRNLDVTPKN
jgi:hypothetical protein